MICHLCGTDHARWQSTACPSPPAKVLTDRESIVRWLRALGRRCPSLGLPDRQYWYEGVADEIEQAVDRRGST